MAGPNIRDLLPRFPVYASYPQHTIVKLRSDGSLEKAAKGDLAIGTIAMAADPADADTYKRAATLLPFAGASCVKCISAGAVAVAAATYQADDGKADDVSTSAKYLGVALTIATGANQIFEVLLVPERATAGS